MVVAISLAELAGRRVSGTASRREILTVFSRTNEQESVGFCDCKLREEIGEGENGRAEAGKMGRFGRFRAGEIMKNGLEKQLSGP